MTTARPESPRLIELVYEWAAENYLRSLPLEHFMESTDQSMQREITVESLALVRAVRPDFQVFSELLIQYPLPGADQTKPERVVPDNMVVIWPEPLNARKSFNTPLQPTGPTLVMEYVSQSNRRKDYEENYHRYRDELKVPYYLVFDHEEQRLDLFRLQDEQYVNIQPDGEGRRALPELEMEIGLIDGWVRYWHRGALLALPGELLNQLRAKDDQLDAAREQVREKSAETSQLLQRASTAEQRASTAEQRASTAEQEIARLRDELERLKRGAAP